MFPYIVIFMARHMAIYDHIVYDRIYLHTCMHVFFVIHTYDSYQHVFERMWPYMSKTGHTHICINTANDFLYQMVTAVTHGGGAGDCDMTDFLVYLAMFCPDLACIDLRFGSETSKSASGTSQNPILTKLNLFRVNIAYSPHTKKSVTLHTGDRGGSGGVTRVTENQ